MAIKLSTSMKPYYDFVIQVLLGAAMFLAIYLIAMAISVVVNLTDKWGLSPTWLVDGAHWVEWSLFWLDVFTFALFLVAEVLTFVGALWRRILKSWKEDE